MRHEKIPTRVKGLLWILLVLFILAAMNDAASALVMEDDPGWNCATDGNRICGPGFGPLDYLETLTVWTGEGRVIF